MSKNLLLFKEKIEFLEGKVVPIDISPGTLVRGKKYHLTKIKKVLIALSKIIAIKKVDRNEKVKFYLPPDGGFGLVYSILLTTIASFKCHKIYLHHRSYAYINKYSVLMAVLNAAAGKKATHIFLSEKMANDFSKKYRVDKYYIVSNLIHVKNWFELNLEPKKYTQDEIVLGFMSNISIEKGIKDAVNTTFMLREKGINAKLKIGGVCDNIEIENYLKDTIKSNPSYFKFVGFVDKNSKLDFFKELDWFLFPTRYVNEAQPNVLFESIAAGVPFITIERGCIIGDFPDYPYVMREKENFPEFATKAIIDNITPYSYEKNRADLVLKVRHQLNDAERKENAMFENILN
ncbi:glycosyl transferases group 1 family protein [Klebsiella pneumoniae]|nr:glycosyl transferases group 1 family protein [Klebsiella pneumoniae]